MTGGAATDFNLGPALYKRLTIKGTVLRARSIAEKAAATRAFSAEVLPLLENGKVKPNVDKVFSVEDVKAAHEYLESNESFGKVILEF